MRLRANTFAVTRAAAAVAAAGPARAIIAAGAFFALGVAGRVLLATARDGWQPIALRLFDLLFAGGRMRHQLLTAPGRVLLPLDLADFVQFGRGGLEQLDVALLEFDIFAARQVAHRVASDMCAHQPLDRIAKQGGHAPNLPVAALGHHDLEDRHVALAAHDVDEALSGLDGRAVLFIERNAARPAVSRSAVHAAVDDNLIGLGVFIARVSQRLGEVAIVGEDDQSFTFCVEPAEQEQVAVDRHHIAHGRAVVAGLALGRGQDVDRLVVSDVDRRGFQVDALAVHGDDVFLRVGLRAKLCDLPVDAHAPGGDQIFGGTARPVVGLRQQLLQTVFHRVWILLARLPAC